MSGLGAKNPSGSVGLCLGQPATISEAVIRWAAIGLTTRRLELRTLAPPHPASCIQNQTVYRPIR